MVDYAVMVDAPFGLLEVEGPDRQDFLNRLLSNEMHLRPGQATGSYFLNVQGRPLARFWCFDDGKATWLVSPDASFDEGFRQLDMMHFGEKLRIRKVADWRPLLWTGPGRRQALQNYLGNAISAPPWSCQKGEDWLLCSFPLLASGSDLLWIGDQHPRPEAPPLSADAFHLDRIRAGRAWPSDWAEKTMMLEIAEDSDYLDGKGCYPGQEVVARTLHRGHVNRKLLPVQVQGTAQSGDKLYQGDKEIGWLSSIQSDWGLAYIRSQAWEPGTSLATKQGVQITVSAPTQEIV